MSRPILRIDEVLSFALLAFFLFSVLASGAAMSSIWLPVSIFYVPIAIRLASLRLFPRDSYWLAIVMVLTCPFSIYSSMMIGFTGRDFFDFNPFDSVVSFLCVLPILYFSCSSVYALVWLCVTALKRRGKA